MDQLRRREEVLKLLREIDREKRAAKRAEDNAHSLSDCGENEVLVDIQLTTCWMGEEYVELGLGCTVPLDGKSNANLMIAINKAAYDCVRCLLRETIIELGERFEDERDKEEGDEDGLEEGWSG